MLDEANILIQPLVERIGQLEANRALLILEIERQRREISQLKEKEESDG